MLIFSTPYWTVIVTWLLVMNPNTTPIVMYPQPCTPEPKLTC